MGTVGDKSNRKAKGSGGERRAEILAAAERIFLKGGYEGATIRKIADEVGVSPTALYMHFPDKHAMLTAIGDGALQALLHESQNLASGSGDAKDRLKGVLRAHLNFAITHKTAYQVVFADGARAISKQRSETQELCDLYCGVLKRLMAELHSAARLKKGSALAVAHALWAGCHGLAVHLTTNQVPRQVDAPEVIDLMVEGLVDGLVV